MTAVGWIGLGRLGLPLALVLDAAGHAVTGYDIDPLPGKILAGRAEPPAEDRIGALLDGHDIRMAGGIGEVVDMSDVVFVAVQTPHAPAYGGETPVPARRRDFEYGYLAQACRDVCAAAAARPAPVTLVVVSTVLPGTCDRLIRPFLGRSAQLVYSPAFTAMGTAIPDFSSPELTLCGCDGDDGAEALAGVLGKVHDAPMLRMPVASAELAKVAYNTFISMKIVFANTIMEMAHQTGADCDDVTRALAAATTRVVSPMYLSGGMGDGGACHPRDLIAMSWLAQRAGLSYDLPGELARARELQAGWIADLAAGYAAQAGLPVQIMGRAYRAGMNLTAGSPALLLADLLAEQQAAVAGQWDPHVDGPAGRPDRRAVYVIATRHPEFAAFDYPPGSVVIDPHGYIPDRHLVTVIRVGRKT